MGKTKLLFLVTSGCLFFTPAFAENLCQYGKTPFEGAPLFRGTDDGVLEGREWVNVTEVWGWETYDFVLCKRADGTFYVIETHKAVALGKLRDVPLEVVKTSDLGGRYKDKRDLAVHVAIRPGDDSKIYDLFEKHKNLKLAFRIIRSPGLKRRLDLYRREIGASIYYSRLEEVEE